MSALPCELFRNSVFEQFARIGKAISSPKRLELLDLLGHAERTVEVLAEEAGLSVANASQHLHVLRAAGLVEAQKQGLFVTYRIADPAVTELLESIRALAEQRLAELAQITRRFALGAVGMDKVDADGLLERMRDETVFVLDVRPPEEFQAAHIPHAISVPAKEIEQYLSQLPRDKQIVAYCRGRYCVLAMQAVQKLCELGYHAAALDGGIQGWRARGYETESGGGVAADAAAHG
jgi:rhodanese-related sulfurtransferase/DNA-binding transcriptional ArsR family regulator